MKEDILEQLVDSYFLRKPATFTKHNVKFRPDLTGLSTEEKRKYSVHSDIDVIAVQFKETGEKDVSIISCKSWQTGFDVRFFYENLSNLNNHTIKVGAGPIWKKFRELVDEKWAKGFRDAVFRETGTYDFTYYIAVTKLINENRADDFKKCTLFIQNLKESVTSKVQIEFITLEKMIKEIFAEENSTKVESTEIGRFIQLLKAAGITNLKS